MFDGFNHLELPNWSSIQLKFLRSIIKTANLVEIPEQPRTLMSAIAHSHHLYYTQIVLIDAHFFHSITEILFATPAKKTSTYTNPPTYTYSTLRRANQP